MKNFSLTTFMVWVVLIVTCIMAFNGYVTTKKFEAVVLLDEARDSEEDADFDHLHEQLNRMENKLDELLGKKDVDKPKK